MNCNKLTDGNEITRLTQQKFDEIYTIAEILKGDTVAMMAECRKWVVETYHREALTSYMVMEAHFHRQVYPNIDNIDINTDPDMFFLSAKLATCESAPQRRAGLLKWTESILFLSILCYVLANGSLISKQHNKLLLIAHYWLLVSEPDFF